MIIEYFICYIFEDFMNGFAIGKKAFIVLND